MQRSVRDLFFYRTEVWKSTPTLRLLLLCVLVIVPWATRDWWTPALGWSLACAGDITGSDVLLIENLEPNYLVFERAAQLQQQRHSARTLVLVQGSADGGPGRVPAGVAAVFGRIAHLSDPELLPIQEIEPFTMNAAYQARQALLHVGARSMTIVSPGFRSRRTLLVYRRVMEPAGIQVGCVQVWGTTDPENWTHTWHGIQEVLLQVVKLAYYEGWVLIKDRISSGAV